MPKLVYFEDEDASFSYEILDKDLILHCEVFRWTPSVLRKAYWVLGDFMFHKRKEGYERMLTVTPNPKFAKLFGGKTIAHIEKDGKTYEGILWELKQQSFSPTPQQPQQ